MKRFLLFLLLSVSAFAQNGVFIPTRTVFGTVNGSTHPIAGATVTVCGPNAAGIPCSPALANAVFKDSGLTVPLSNPFTTDANGNYPQAALAGGVYTITESSLGFAGFSYQATVACAPGAGCTINGPFVMSQPNGQFFVTNPPFSGGCPGAVTAAGTTVGTVVVVPGSGPIVDCPSPTAENIVIENHDKTRDICNGVGGAALPPCEAHNYIYDDGNVFAYNRFEFTTNHQDAGGVSLGLYALTYLKNATANGNSGADGFSGEVHTVGTLSGTFAGITAHEADANVHSTGGTLTIAQGVLGYVNTFGGSTTAVTNAYGIHGVGCSTIAGAAPTNCFGGFFERQIGASGRNYAIGWSGPAIAQYNSGLGIGGLDCEDNGNTTRRCLFVDNTNAPGNHGVLNLQAVSADGFRLSTADGLSRLTMDSIGRLVVTQSIGLTGGSTFVANTLFVSQTSPTIAAAGCGGSAAAMTGTPNGTAAFQFNTGTAPTSACTITMPAAANGWACDANTVSATSTTNFIVKQTGAVSTTSVTLTLFSDVAAATSFAASDTVRVKCTGF